MRNCLIALILCLGLSVTTSAQEASDNRDEVIVEGQRRGADPAMQAFLSGDYATAEIEFERNFSRLIRNQRLERSSIEQGASDAISGQVTEGAGIGASTPATGALAENQGILSAPNTFTRRQTRSDDETLISSGTDLGSQLYMAGLSELQLQKFDEAEESFTRALRLNSTLLDAHYRLGLIALQNGDAEEARRRLAVMERELDRCHSRCERLGNREALETGIAQLSYFLGLF